MCRTAGFGPPRGAKPWLGPWCSLSPVGTIERASFWQRWFRQPQTVWLRRALLQVHLWTGIGLGLYIGFISVTGSVLVYRNELYVAATPDAGVPQGTVTTGFWMVSRLIELHDDLLAGPTGRRVNGIGALGVLLVALTGAVIWWPGVARWRRSLTLRLGVPWRRLAWDLHSAIGVWSLAFVLVFGLSGVYLCFPEEVQAAADALPFQPHLEPGLRTVDQALSWLAYLHFGRINGIGIPCGGPGLCDQVTKAVWATFGLAPAVLFVTGTTMWWHRVLRPWWRSR